MQTTFGNERPTTPSLENEGEGGPTGMRLCKSE